jgi:photosystem II stability/assembly factor-like uncharacterized protein
VRPLLLSTLLVTGCFNFNVGNPANDLANHGGGGDMAVNPGGGWVPVQVSATTDLTSVWTRTPGEVYVGGGFGINRLLGGNWGELTLSSILCVWGSGADIFAGGDNQIFHSSNQGNSWPNLMAPGSGVKAIWGASATDVYAADLLGQIYHLDGQTWNVRYRPEVMVGLSGLWGSGPSTSPGIVAVGLQGTILVSQTGLNQSFSTVTSPVTTNLNGVFGFAPNEHYVVGDNGVILKGTGDGYTPLTSGVTVRLNAVWGPSSGDVFVVGDGGTILHTTDGGTSFIAQPSGTQSNLRGIFGTSAGDVWAVGEKGTVLHYQINGANT